MHENINFPLMFAWLVINAKDEVVGGTFPGFPLLSAN
jgi:hypothetical protein